MGVDVAECWGWAMYTTSVDQVQLFPHNSLVLIHLALSSISPKLFKPLACITNTHTAVGSSGQPAIAFHPSSACRCEWRRRITHNLLVGL